MVVTKCQQQTIENEQFEYVVEEVMYEGKDIYRFPKTDETIFLKNSIF